MPSLNILRHDDIFRANPTARETPPPKPYWRLLPVLLEAIVMFVIISLFFLFMGIAAISALHLLIHTGAFRDLHRHLHRRLVDAGDPSNVALSSEELLRFLPWLKFAAGFYPCHAFLGKSPPTFIISLINTIPEGKARSMLDFSVPSPYYPRTGANPFSEPLLRSSVVEAKSFDASKPTSNS